MKVLSMKVAVLFSMFFSSMFLLSYLWMPVAERSPIAGELCTAEMKSPIADLFGPKPLTAPPGAVILSPGMSVAAIVNRAPPGTTFWFQPGEYREVSIKPKANQRFLGAKGAVLNGSRLVTGFTRDRAGRWIATGQTQKGERRHTMAGISGSMRAGYPETFFIDDKPLTPVDSLYKVGPGRFYFDYAANRIVFADDPTGRKVEAGTTGHAFLGNAAGVTVRNLVIEKYIPAVQKGAIQGNANWTIADNEIRLNYAVGATAQGGSVFIGNYVHDNGQMGLGGNGKNLRVEGNEIARNGHWSGIGVFWEGGGVKFAGTDNLIVRSNFSHANNGFGLWTDIDNTDTLYDGNLLVHNSGGGINHEISYDAVIRDNTLIGNGFKPQGEGLWGGGIQIQNSKNLHIHGNLIDMTGGNGIALIQQDRGTGLHGVYSSTNNRIQHNIIVSRDGRGASGSFFEHGGIGPLKSGNVWDHNVYIMADGPRWWWGDLMKDGNWSVYRDVSNQDRHSTLSQDYPDTCRWATDALLRFAMRSHGEHPSRVE